MTLSPISERALGCDATLHLIPVYEGGCRIGSAGSRGDEAVRLLGLNYRSSDVSLRSRAALSGDRLERLLGLLREHGVSETAILSTCNRTEIYWVGGEIELVTRLLAQATGVAEDELKPGLYRKIGVCAACHLFRVASGLDSAVLGESEIVAQVKAAWREASFTGPSLDLLFQRALEASKRVRTETNLCRNVTSLGSLAVREAQRYDGPLAGRNVLILGAGQIANRVAKELASAGIGQVTILNRTVERAQSLAERFGFAGASLDELPAYLEQADIVFAAATVDTPIVSRADLSAGRDPLFIDLGIPPNIDKRDLRAVDVDALASTCARNADSRSEAIPEALDILEAELERYLVALTERQAAPTIRVLAEHGEAVRQRTVEWAMDRLPNLDEKERRVVEELARRMVLGMLTPTMEELKKGSFTPQERATVERAFRHSGGVGRFD